MYRQSGDEIAARSFVSHDEGWAVGTTDGLCSLILHTRSAGGHWTVQMRDGAGFPLVGVDFVDGLHGWAVASSGTLVGSIIATVDGGRTWRTQGEYGPLTTVEFTDLLHGTVEGSDGDSPQRPPACAVAADVAGAAAAAPRPESHQDSHCGLGSAGGDLPVKRWTTRPSPTDGTCISAGARISSAITGAPCLPRNRTRPSALCSESSKALA